MSLRQPQPNRCVAANAIHALLFACCTFGASLAYASDDIVALLRSPPGAEIPLSQLDERLARDAADGALDEFSLPAAALVAEGVRDLEVLVHYERKLHAKGDALGHRIGIDGTPRERARAVFEFLHQRILTGSYDADCTELSRTLDEGTYNCVSSLLLYRALCQRLGLDMIAVETPGHSFAVLIDAHEAPLEIETTCPDWFELSDAGRRRRQLRAGTGPQHDSDDHREAARRQLSGPALVAIVYYNRAIDLLRRGSFAEAVAANQMALRLDPASVDARENLLATLNNWALDLFDRGDREQSLAVLRFGLAAAPDHGKLHRNFVAISQRLAQEPLEAERTAAHTGQP